MVEVLKLNICRESVTEIRKKVWSLCELINMDAVVSAQWKDKLVDIGRPDIGMIRQFKQLTRGMMCLGGLIFLNSLSYLGMSIFAYVKLDPAKF